MITVPVDLFSPWIKGREYAIDRNWNDMNQSNNVERGWLDNDKRQMENWFAEDTYGDRISNSNANTRINQNAATGSDYDIQTAGITQPGRNAQAQSQSDYAIALSNTMGAYLPEIAQNQTVANRGQAAANAAQGQAAIQFAPAIYSGNAQNQIATQGYNRAVMNNQLAQQAADRPLQQKANEVRTMQLDAILNGTQPMFPGAPTTAAGQSLGSTPMFAPPGGNDQPSAQDFRGVMSSMPSGSETTVTIKNKQYSVGKDASGRAYLVANGQRHYIGQEQAAPVTMFSWGDQQAATGMQHINGIPTGTVGSVPTMPRAVDVGAPSEYEQQYIRNVTGGR